MIVNPQWVYDCEKKSFKVNENDPKYAVTREVSTPQKDNGMYIKYNQIRSGMISSFCIICELFPENEMRYW